MLFEILAVISATVFAIGVFYNFLPEPDERFEPYPADLRRTGKKAGPWMWRVGLGVLVLSLVARALTAG